MAHIFKWSASLTLLALAASAAAAAEPVSAITKASQDVTLSYGRPGRVAKVLVKEGDSVAADQPLVLLDAREEQAALASDQAKAKDDTRVTAQQAILEQKNIAEKKAKDAHDHGAESDLEYDAARIDVVVADAQLKIAVVEHEQDQLKAAQTKAAVDKMTLRAPVKGIIEPVIGSDKGIFQEGEGVEANSKVIRVVNIDPLEIEVAVAYDQARQMQKGAAVHIIFSDNATGDGTIKSVSQVADGASNTIQVLVSVPNPTLRPAGERVQVDFSNGKVAAH